jgi:large subunit ribosomal protein L17
MRHRNAGRTLGRNASHRLALMRNLTRALIEHGRIVTTVAKAKEVRPFVERLITIAKQGTLHARRLVLARLRDKDATTTLIKEVAPRFMDRPGGYTRIIRRHERRLGDAGETAFLELLKEGETKVRAREPQAPTAPRVEKPAEPAPTATTPPPAESPPAS